MPMFRSILVVSTVIAVVSGAAGQQTMPQGAAVSAAPADLPPGLIRKNGVVMMQPIGDSDTGHEFPLGAERRPGLVRFLKPTDHDLYTRAFDAADRADWITARRLADQGSDPVGRRLVEWRYLLDKNSGATFDEIAQFLRDHPRWPARDTLFARAEEAMSPLSEPRSVIEWFGDRTPVTGIGKVRLGEALLASGSPPRARELIRNAWIEDSFTSDQELGVIARHGDILTPDVDRERFVHLLARNELTAARLEIPRLNANDRRLAEARIALRADTMDGERQLGDLPPELRDDPGLSFDEARLYRQRDKLDVLPALISRARGIAQVAPTQWWDELNLETRQALQEGRVHIAYELVTDPGLSMDTTQYPEAQFLAGWIALRRLNAPELALAHFERLEQAVTRPISRARALFWKARAYEAEGDLTLARRFYRRASELPQTFYGQLALARLSPTPRLQLHDSLIDVGDFEPHYENDGLTSAMRVLADLGAVSILRDFAVHAAESDPDPRNLKLIAEDLARMGFRDVAVRVAKEAGYNGIYMLNYSHPVIAIPAYHGPGTAPEPALVLGIIRQETEFDPDAVSSAGARGIMQVMPETALRKAPLAGLAYDPAALSTDVTYNMQLGMTELAGDLDTWVGSYVLAAAAYNAGPGNVRKWIAIFGDPRDARVDPVDWIEEIPFEETRNYVQRVIENIEIYRNRLAGRDEPLRILDDLYRPNAPQIASLGGAPRASSESVPGLPLPARRPGAESAADDATGGSPGPVAPKFKPTP